MTISKSMIELFYAQRPYTLCFQSPCGMFTRWFERSYTELALALAFAMHTTCWCVYAYGVVVARSSYMADGLVGGI